MRWKVWVQDSEWRRHGSKHNISIGASCMDEWKDLNVQAVQKAAQRLAGQVVHTPVLRSAAIDEQVGAQVSFKCENLQRVGAVKFRGAYKASAALDDAHRARGGVAFAPGTAAQAVDLDAKTFS